MTGPTVRTCLRCDWEGDTSEAACPDCKVLLYVVGAPQGPIAPEPARTDHLERSDDAVGTGSLRVSASGSRGSDPPSSGTDARGSVRSTPSAGALVLVALVLTAALGAWLDTNEEWSGRAASADLVTPPTRASDASGTAVVTPSATPAAISPRGPDIGKHTLTVGGVPFSYRVTTSGWERFGDVSINKSIVGPQGAEAIVFWSTFPHGDIAKPCAFLNGLRPGSSAGDLAAALARAPGTELDRRPSNVTVDGLTAKHVVLIVRKNVGCDPGYFFTWQDAEVGALWSRTPVGSTIRMWIVDVGTLLVVIEAETSKLADSDLEREIRRIVGSIRFEAIVDA